MGTAAGLLRGGAAAVVAAVALTGCSAEPTADTDAKPLPSGSAAAGITEVALAEPIDHVHGLVAVSESRLVAGTHSGARSIGPDGSVAAAGEDPIDLMGMTGEPGTERLASSGHPGPGSPLPDPVGLLRSDDAGATWKPVSLQGQIDFHALTMSGDTLVGYGGGPGLLLSSDGGKTWRDGAQIQPAALAVSDDRILATTEAGLQVSTDGGSSFTKIKDAPLLALVSAADSGAAVGLDPEGTLWRSSDAGRTWQRVGRAPDAQAVAALDGQTSFAIGEEALYVVR